MINLNQLIYLYEQQPMRFDLQVNTGECIAILGPSGAGKSTLLNLIAGFITANSGNVWLNGQDHSHTPPAKRPVSMLFQDNNLFAHLTVEQNIGLGLHPGLKLSPQQQQQCQQIMEQSGLLAFAKRLPNQLSGGQRQRVALARCLVRQQPILLLDEPFSALDPALRFEMLSLVETMCQQRNLTLLMVSHNIDDAVRIAPRSLIIAEGQIAYDGTTQNLINGQTDVGRIIGLSAK